jgi:6-phosphofructokinase
VKQIKGFRYGYEGLGEKSSFMWLTPSVVDQIHHFGGTLIGEQVQKVEKVLL